MTTRAQWIVVLYGSHGGELDREPVTPQPGPSGARAAVTRLAARCTLDAGDRIVIEGERTLGGV